MELWPGKSFPLGSTWDGKGVNFAIFSANATRVELCLYENDGVTETARIPVREANDQIWHIYIPGLGVGQRYGYRISGPYEPQNGHRFNPNKLLIDPYAKAIAGTVTWDDSVFGYEIGHPEEDLSFSETDSAPFVPKSVVIDPSFNWDGDSPPNIPFHRTVIYEAHVRGFTIQHPDIPPDVRGTYRAFTCQPVLDYLKNLGITAIELMPVHHFIADRYLMDKGLTNYWGYNSIGYFAPHAPFSSSGVSGEQVVEFKEMVKALHREGIEVILDVVYNHTAEGNQMGPTLSFRGIDNAAYYRLVGIDPRFYMDYTGTGNTMNMVQPNVLRLIMDSLRYWIEEMHVDGFRFDLASALARELHDVDRLGSFFDIIHQDPVISQVKLIAEPWDVGEGGYQVGNFPPGWAEWNGKYRDAMRDFWRGEEKSLPEFAYRFTGSSDLYDVEGRKPTASINFITAHDGFNLTDLVSYNEKHNEANLEDNQDGHNDNRSWNHGVEGPTDNPEINKLRNRQKRNFLATLLLSQGVPMLLSGDEMGKTRNGNNNPYAQDNETTWINWETIDQDLLEFTRKLIQMRSQHEVFRRRGWFRGRQFRGKEVSDIAWFNMNGDLMTEEDWSTDLARTLQIFLSGQGFSYPDERGRKITDQSFLLLINSSPDDLEFSLPEEKWGGRWLKVVDTAQQTAEEKPAEKKAGDPVAVTSRSLVVFCHAD